MSLCCKTKINAPFSYDVPDKEMKKSEILPIRLWQNMAMSPQEVTWREFFNTIFTS